VRRASPPDVALIFVALGAILLWFLIAPFLKPSPSAALQDIDPRVTCAICDELREEDAVIEREFGTGRFHYLCGDCIRAMADDYAAAHGSLPRAPAAPVADPETDG